MIRILYRPSGQPIRLDMSVTDLPLALAEPDGLLWLDLVGVPAVTAEPILRDVFGFHPLAIDDALQEKHTPKIDSWGDYLYLVFRTIVLGPTLAGEEILTPELDVFLGDNYLVTYHGEEFTVVDRVWASMQKDERHLTEGPDHVLYRLVDEIAADDARALERIDQALDDIEVQIFKQAGTTTLESIFDLKRALLTLRRYVSPQREVLNRLARDDYPMIDPTDRVFFRDVYDHLVRLVDLTDSLRELVTGAMETYLSVMNNRMNDIMKTLTIITTLFMPLAFVTGFFGMNFFQPSALLDGWTGTLMFALTLVGMLLIPFGMFLWMRHRAWM